MAKDTVVEKKSEAQKQHGTVTSVKDFPQFEQVNMLSVDADTADYLKELGFVHRFINWNLYKHNTNMHRSHWRPFEFPTEVREDKSKTWTNQINSEGLIRRGDLVLSVRPLSMHEQHKKQLAELNQVYSQFESKKANEFRDFAQNYGVKTTVNQGTVEKKRV